MRSQALICTRCKLHTTRTNVVWGSGPIKSMVKLVGEAPGFNEDEAGYPFCGRTGTYLTGTLIRISGVKQIRRHIFVTNMIMCRPPNNRQPTDEEIRACGIFLRYKLNHHKPKVVGCIGRVSADHLIGIGSEWNKEYNKNGVIYIPVYHPSYVIRKQQSKDIVESFEHGLRTILQRGGIEL